MEEDMEGIRINKYLSEAGICSRREADRLIQAGRVLLDGQAAVPGDRILEGQEVILDGKRINKEEEEIFLAFYKPKGIVCTTANTEHGERIQNVVEYIQYPKRVYPVGRLDKDSEGLLLMTNQGEAMERILRSRYGHEKEYFVKVDHKIDDAFLQGIERGVPVLDTITKPCKAWKESETSFRIILTQGLNRQIRRMCEYFGYRVVYLRRDRVMNITLDGLKKGRYRKLTAQEIRELKREIKKENGDKV
ncbi:MAG TPA: 23S rRNA pseudouridine synthase F [Lachnospiraceae bacterium]|nr:23S rRNA pseudouridine synthase F [Lachnospiraceae bacterium]